MKHEVSRAARVVVRDTLTAARKPVASRRFQDAVARSSGPVHVAVGGGHINLESWLNTDKSWRAQYYLDLAKPWPVPDGSIDRVYADSVIEHFPLAVGREVLRYIHRALAPGGAVRLSTCDVERTARAYLENGDLATRHLERHRKHGYAVHHPVDLLRVTFAECEHYLGYCFDYATLAAEMSDAGFVDVHREEAGESGDSAFADLEARASDTERATQLVVEGRKP